MLAEAPPFSSRKAATRQTRICCNRQFNNLYKQVLKYSDGKAEKCAVHLLHVILKAAELSELNVCCVKTASMLKWHAVL